MKNVLISGWYGFGNVGDEAILQALIEKYQKAGQKVTTLSFRPKYTNMHQEIPAAHQVPISTKGWIAFIVKFRWIKTLRFLLECDIFVMGGGGFISDWQPRVPKVWLRQLKLAKTMGKATALYGVGVGPFFSDDTLKFVRKTLENYVDSISVRDVHSYNWLVEKCSLNFPLVSIEVDPVATMDVSCYRAFPQQDKAVAVVYARYFDRPKLFGDAKRKEQELENLFRVQMTTILKAGYSVNVISFQPQSEGEWLNKLCEGLNVQIIRPSGFKNAISEISKCKAVVSFRLHGNVIAHALQLPFLPIIYHHKTMGFLEMIGKSSCHQLTVGDGINLPATPLSAEEWEVTTKKFLATIP